MKNTIKLVVFILFFLICFFIDYSQFSYWFALIAPLLILISLKIKLKRNSSFNYSIGLFAFTVIQLLIYCIIYPENEYLLKRTITFGLIITNVYLLFNYMNEKKISELFNPFIISSFIFSLIILYDSNFNSISQTELIGKNILGGLLFSVICILLLSKNNLNKYIKFLLLLWFLLILFFTGSLKFIIVSLIICTYYYFKYNKFKLKHLILPFVFIIYFFNSFSLFFENNNILNIVFSRFLSLLSLQEYSSLNLNNPYGARDDLITLGLDIFYNNPFFGIGLEGSRSLMPTYTHNTYLEILIGGGMFVFIPFFIALIIPLFSFYKNNNWFLLLIYICILGIAWAQRIYDNQIIFILMCFLMKLNEKQKRTTYN